MERAAGKEGTVLWGSFRVSDTKIPDSNEAGSGQEGWGDISVSNVPAMQGEGLLELGSQSPQTH